MYIFLTIADPLQSLRLMQEGLSLESKLNCHGATDLVLKTDNNSQDLRGIKKLVFELDWKACLSEASQHLSTSLATKIATHTTWPKLWDMAWIMAHKAQLHCRLYIVLSPDPAAVKSHVLSVTITPPNHLILNTFNLSFTLCQLSLLSNY